MDLNLENFECACSRDTPFVLTSPTSLEACAQLEIEPKDLTYKSLEEYEQVFSDLPLSEVYRIYDKNETLRQENLLKCRELRSTMKENRTRGQELPNSVEFKEDTCTLPEGYHSDAEKSTSAAVKRKSTKRRFHRSVPDLSANLDFNKPKWSPRDHFPCRYQFDDNRICLNYLNSYADILDSGALSSEDRKILECLILKKGRALEWDKQCQYFRSTWEIEKLNRYRAEQLFLQSWHDRLMEKRRNESTENAKRYLELQSKWRASRDNLKKQLEARDTRVQKFLEDLNHQRRLRLIEKQKSEAIRQLQVGRTIEKLMEEDRVHRQLIRDKLQRKLAEAEVRKRRKEYDYWRHVQEMNRLEDAKRCVQLEKAETQARQTIEELRSQIEDKEHRAHMNYLSLQRVKAQSAGQGSLARAKATEKAQRMHSQLLYGLEEWHKKVMELHVAAQDRAELKYLEEINRRRARAATERVLREERTLAMMRKVKENEEKRRELVLQVIDCKETKVAQHKAEKDRKIQISRVRAQQAAELRQKLREQLDPETFDRKAARVELELRVLRKHPTNFHYKFAPRMFLKKCCPHCKCRKH